MAELRGYHADRYQQHDATIEKLVIDFNKDKATFIDCTAQQATGIPNLTPEMIKAWIIQESGGGDRRSLDAWKIDPAQINVPGDWSEYKSAIGLKKPTKRNEGSLETNLRAAIIWLARKGFGKSGQPPSNRPTGVFDGWKTAFQRYNGRTVVTENGKPYSTNYAQRIVDRATKLDEFFTIELPRPVAAGATEN